MSDRKSALIIQTSISYRIYTHPLRFAK